MSETVISGQQKYENYREQFKRLKKALDNGFNLEAIFIEYAIMEDRTESIIRHAGKWEAYLRKKRGGNPTIHSKVKFIQKAAEQKGTAFYKYFSDDLLEHILVWKDERNRMIHALLKQELEHGEVAALALQGNELVRILRSRSGSCNRLHDKQRGSGNQ